MIYACLQWFYAQPFTFKENLHAAAIAPLRNDVHCVLGTVFCASPLLVTFLWRFSFRHKPIVVVLMLVLPLVYLLCLHMKVISASYWLAPFFSDSFSAIGFDVPGTLMGTRPDVMRSATRVLLTVMTLASMIACIFTAGSTATKPFRVPERAADCTRAQYISLQALSWLFGPYLLAYIALVTTREVIFDRYWLPPLFIFTVFLLRTYAERVAQRLALIDFVPLACMSLFVVASDHDFFATLRARQLAAITLQHGGVPRTAMYAGFEYDGWTELEMKGPACGNPSPYAPITYRTWLLPHTRHIYILRNSPLPYPKEEQALHDPT